MAAGAARARTRQGVSLNALPPVSHLAAFNEAWTAATRAGRVLSLIFALSFVLAFAYLLRALVRDWRVALLGAIFLAFSGGMAMQMRILRTELLASGFFFCALLMLLIVARRGALSLAAAWSGFASVLMTLAMLNKIQIIFLICALPVILLPFGPTPSKDDFWQPPGRAVVALIRRRRWRPRRLSRLRYPVVRVDHHVDGHFQRARTHARRQRPIGP